MDWKALVKTVAPVLGTALGGPLGAMAVKTLADSLLPPEAVAGKPQGALERLLETTLVGADPSTLTKLKEIDQAFAIRLEELTIDVYKLDNEEKQSARKFAVDTSILPQIFITLIYNLGYFVILYGLLSGSLSLAADIKDVGLVLIGMLTQTVTETIKFWFGSSVGSKAKNNLIEKLKGNY